MKIFMYNDPRAPSYYRVELPFYQCQVPLYREGIELSIGSDVLAADAYLFHYVTDRKVWDVIEKLHAAGKKIILSLDDNLWAVPDWNPFKCDVAKVEWLLDVASVVWVSTEALREVIDRRTVVLPNLLDAEDWPVTARPKNETLRILWAGSACHEPDLEVVGRLFSNLLDRYPDVACYFFGSWPTSTSEWVRLKASNYGTLVPAGRFGGRLGYILPVERGKFPEALQAVNPDLCVAALEDSPFARCKSNLKWLEYSAVGAPTVATDLPPYQGTTALLYDLFENCCRLIEDRSERERLGAASQAEVMANWTWQGSQKELWLNAFRTIAEGCKSATS